MSIVKERAWQLVKGFIGINITFILSGILYEKIAKNSYYNFETNNYDLFRSSVGYSLVLRFVTWILSQIYSYMTLKKQEKVKIADKNKIVCGVIIFVSSISFMQAMYLVSYPFIMMAKSSNILQVVLVGVFCSRVKDKKARLGKQKLITSLVVTIGIILFKVFDPETQFSFQGSMSGEMMGLVFLLVNMLADCFLPDFQAQIKEKFKPNPVQMQTEISKWSFLICLAYANFSGDLSYTLDFMITHPMFSLELLILSVLSFLGQTFVYKIIKKFQQHIVPLIVGTRKTFTVALSLIYFDHRTSFGQVFGILVVFSATIWEFMTTLHKKEQKEAVKQQGMKKSENDNEKREKNQIKKQTQSTFIQIQPTPPKFNFTFDNSNQMQESNTKIKQNFMIEEAHQKNENDQNSQYMIKKEILSEQKDTDTSN